MSTIELLLLIGISPIGLYVAARVISAAFYQSKLYYERNKDHGSKKQPSR